MSESRLERFKRTGGGMKIGSKGKGRGLARGQGKGPMGVPVKNKARAKATLARYGR